MNTLKKNYLFIIILFFSFHLAYTAQDSVLIHAQQAYKNNDFKQALSLFEKVPEKTAHVWFYMGNCSYQINDTMNALLYWQRAYQYGTGLIVYKSAQNYDAVARKLSIYDDVHKQSFFNNVNKIVHSLPFLLIQILFFCVFSVFLLLSYRLYCQKKYSILTSLFLSLFMMCTLLKIAYHEQLPRALIMPEQVTAYAGPSNEYHDLFVVPAGLPVIVCKDQKDWIKIDYGKQHGWVQKKQVALI